MSAKTLQRRAAELPQPQFEQLAEQAAAEAQAGWAPPEEIYRVDLRRRIDWGKFPLWARPSDPELFDGCCHEG